MSSNDRFPLIEGYLINQLVCAGSRTLVYRGIRLADGYPVVLKLLRSDRPSIQDLLRLRNHYTITKNLNSAGIVRPLGLEPYGNGFVLLMPDDRCMALSDYLVSYSLELPEFLAIAIQLAEILQDLYQQRVIHKDIKPANILIQPESKQIKLIDFSLASLLPKETSGIVCPNVLEGTLAYIAPEQTGRMNRGIDYRTDFYALGVTLFELLTGQLPFQADDSLELVHCHIAKPAPSACELKPEIPAEIAQIVTKLMAKNAEDRYQSTLGLKYDLAIALHQFNTTGTIAPFVIGTRDLSDRFSIPEKLYGRSQEVQTLLTAFERVANGVSELMLVAGFSGIGKTAIVNEVHKPIVRQRGYFIKGKFDQFNRNIPLSAFVQAFRDLMGQLLSESDTQLQQWQAKIRAALGENGQVIVEVIPELERIIGKQPPVPELSGSAVQNRFNLMFEKFIQVFTTKEHPLVIFLDDLQWVDSASLKLMQLLMSESQSRYLLLIGAYRDNEVFPAHPLMLTLEEIKKQGATLNTITLAPLQRSDINQLVADTLSCTPALALPLSELVYQKTQGNPFFNNQFLKALQEENLISFNREVGYWQCDIAQIKALALTDDVVEFMALQLQKLPPQTQEVMKLAACIGNSFDLEILAIVYQQSPVETATNLWSALQAGLVLPITEIYKFFQGNEPDSDANLFAPTYEQIPKYRFSHDRVQQAAYSLIPEIQKNATHYRMGQQLLKNIADCDLKEHIFEIVNHLNIAIELIKEPAAREELAKLNFIAGCKAKNATAYSAAVRYFALGRSLLASDAWLSQYDLALELYVEATEVAYLNGDIDEMESLIEVVLQQAKTALDKVKVYTVRINAYTSQGRMLEAIHTGLTALQQFAIDLPESPDLEDIAQARQEVQALLSNRNPADLLDLPEMTNPQILAVLQIMHELSVPAYLTTPNLNVLIIMQQMILSMTYGNAPSSTSGYSSYGLLLCGETGDIEQGYEFAQLALNLLAKLNAKKIAARILFVTTAFIIHWKVHVKETLTLLKNAYSVGWESGSLMDLGYAAYVYGFHAYLMGDELTKLEQEIAAYSKVLAKINQQTQLNYNELYHEAVLNLLGQTASPTFLLGEAEKEQTLLARYQQADDKTGLWHFFFVKVMLCYLFQEFEQAFAYIERAEYYSSGGKGMFNIAAFYFYASLIRLAVLPSYPKSEQEDILQQVTAAQEKMQRWAIHAPMNHLHKFDLVEAERYRVLGDRMAAIEHYDRAIALAKENGFIQDEALANELAAKFYLDWGKEKAALGYMQEAYYGYARWGAKAKTDDLKQRYPQLLSPILNQVSTSILSRDTIPLSQTSSYASTSLDLATIIKASQALSSEIQLEKLLLTLIEIVVTNAGADKAALVLNQDGTLKLAIKYFDNAVQSLERKPVDECQHIPLALIHYVGRTLETVITDYKAHVSTASDPYCLQYQPKSLLCAPILNQGKLVAVLYLENAITANAFTDDRVELLKVLCAQAAISLENANLFQQSQSYAQQLEHSLNQLQASETRFRHLAANIPGMIYQLQIAADGSVSVPYTSSACYDLYEVSAEEMMTGKYNFRDFEHVEDSPSVDQMLAHTGRTLQPFSLEFRIVTPSGTVKWIQAVSQPARQPDGSIVWDGVVMDISDRKQLEQEQARLLAILEASSDFIGTANPDGQTTWMNSVFRHLYNLTPEANLTDYRIGDLHPQWALDLLQQEGIPQAVQYGYWIGETALLTPDGREIPVSQVVMAHKSPDGTLEYLSTIIRDISDRKAAEVQLQLQAQQLEEYSQTLEQKVEERTQALSQALINLQATQTELIHSEKMAALGQLTASVAHEINTPLGVIRAATGNIVAASSVSLQQLPQLMLTLTPQQQEEFLSLVNAAIQKSQPLSTKEERQLRRQLQSELTNQGIADASSIAAQLSQMQLGSDLHLYQSILQAPNCYDILQVAYNLALQHQSTRSIQQEVDRAAKIVFALKAYSHQSHSDEKCLAQIADGIEVALTLYHNRLKQGIEIVRNYKEVPEISCNPDELTQVWVNLIDNAIYAIGQQGTLEIAVSQEAEYVVVEIVDSGCGIPPEMQAKIFEPFVTSKPRGEGSGLGLDIVRRIVRKHDGDIQVSSQPSRTTFKVLFPIPSTQ
ncbi:AAA family ATPase [Tumidithrix helvetica PCC 7403]|uniref:ATP-binding sensor histidine kinase n=1 Tax=Tumidithrix helvetica TaxID=3457545 RepID=UPI003C9C379F